MADGTKKPIREVKVGDKVLATDPATGQTAARPVTKLIVHAGKHTMVDVHLADGTTITATDRHPFWDATTGQFTYAIDLHPGDQVRQTDGTPLTVQTTRIYDADLTAYNLTVDDIHTYYAGTTPVLVHNSCFGEAAEAGAGLGDDVVLMRGGTNAVDRFAAGSGVTSDATGSLSGVSVNSGRTIEEAAQGIRHGQVGVSTAGAVREAGGTVVRAPTPYNPGHCLISGCTAETLSDLFTPTIKNPWK